MLPRIFTHCELLAPSQCDPRACCWSCQMHYRAPRQTVVWPTGVF